MGIEEKYAATLASRIFRTIMALLAAFDLEARQYDFVNAFINSQLDDLVYIELPDGFRKDGKVLLLLRALYGLRKSPRLWKEELSKTLLDLGLCAVPEDPCLYVSNKLIVMFYVDDMIVLYQKANEHAAMELERNLQKRYSIRPMGEPEWFLGIRIIRNRAARKLGYVKTLISRKLRTGSICSTAIHHQLHSLYRNSLLHMKELRVLRISSAINS